MKEINLENIIYSYFDIDEISFITENRMKIVMKELAEQLLELAAENAEYNHEFDNAHGCEVSINKQSILDTINQIK